MPARSQRLYSEYTKTLVEQAIAYHGEDLEQISSEHGVSLDVVQAIWVDMESAAHTLSRPKTEQRVECGTPSGYEWHRRNHETSCGPCSEARAEADRAHYERRRAKERAA